MKGMKKKIFGAVIVLAAIVAALFGKTECTVITYGEKVSYKNGSAYLDFNGTIWAPAEESLGAIGCEISPNGSAGITAEKDGTFAEISGEKVYVIKNGERTEIYSRKKGGEVYISLEQLYGAFGYSTVYQEETNTVIANPASEITVHFIDVGQGDCVFIDAGEDEILIDGGTAAYGGNVANYISDYIDGEIEYVIGTHAHSDHIGGLAEVLEEYKVLNVITSGEEYDSTAYKNFLDAAKDSNIIYDDDLLFDLRNGAELKIIEIFDDEENSNNNSVAALFTYNDVSFLFTGDSESEAEELLLTELSSVTVFKAGHHGSSTSNSKELLEKISPEYVVIESGKDNSYGHPHKEALENMFDAGAKVLNTAKSGTIVFKTDGFDIFADKEDFLTVNDIN